MVALDTDVLLLEFAFRRDERQSVNQHFWATVASHRPVVSIYVMELLSKLSLNLPAERLAQWSSWLQNRYQLTILSPQTDGFDATSFFQREIVDQLLQKMQLLGMPFLGGLSLQLVEVAQVDTFATWNARHSYSGFSKPLWRE